MEIIVNGKNRMVGTTEGLTLGDPAGTGTLSYEAIVQLAGYDPKRVLTVVYSTRRKGDEQRSGSMHPGCRPVLIEGGMVFTVADTSNA